MNQNFSQFKYVLSHDNVAFSGDVFSLYRKLKDDKPSFLIDKFPDYEHVKIIGLDADIESFTCLSEVELNGDTYLNELPHYCDIKLTTLPFDQKKNQIEVFVPKIILVLEKESLKIVHRSNDLNIELSENIINEIKDKLKALEAYKTPKYDGFIDFTSNITKEEYQTMFDSAIKHLIDGDVFQVVLSQCFEAKSTLTGLDVFKRACELNPSPYQIYIENRDKSIICTSPERLVSVKDRIVEVVPIAGTRARKYDGKDEKRAASMIKDPKERAEHLMLVDLGRNDVGRVSKTDTVTVDNFCQVKYYQQVMHLVSTVRGKLSDSKSPIDALASVFPAGTVSGAPKDMAMSIIDVEEKDNRKLYGGGICISTAKELDACIAIRTILKEDNKYTIQVGSGIVIKANCHDEYLETINKGRALIQTLSSFYTKGARYDFDYR
ncbi:anthranilate synthase component I family protein [Acidaminobacter sp. JC074]|uniref:anthranilate synthase component I family protein n=1 Tax=Acidaminobacter sp. JC074 TaxID=2530199 RepID=UPI001F0CE599|nr:anthranilate synthase component I family protein [Acidaminobacter sp. JC074]MCH4889981.1 anthranilate synthase component I family protein [Acidaminobacter sp. JC074]